MPAHLFFAYFFWLLFNRTEIAQGVRSQVINWMIEKENDFPKLYYLRYILTKCASCFCFWCNLILCSIVGGIIWIPAFFILTFVIETLYSHLLKHNKKDT